MKIHEQFVLTFIPPRVLRLSSFTWSLQEAITDLQVAQSVFLPFFFCFLFFFSFFLLFAREFLCVYLSWSVFKVLFYLVSSFFGGRFLLAFYLVFSYFFLTYVCLPFVLWWKKFLSAVYLII